MQKTLDKVAKTSRHLEEVRKQEAAALAERNVAIAEALEVGATQIQIAATGYEPNTLTPAARSASSLSAAATSASWRWPLMSA